MSLPPPSHHDSAVINMAGPNHPPKRIRTSSSDKRASGIKKKTKAIESCNNDVNQKAGSAYSLTVPFYNIHLSK
jgi:hypothetical protein